MYLSELTFDPWRRDTGRLLADSYALHQRLLMAFPEAADGGSGRVLFRTELKKGELRLLVQSEREPRWNKLGELACTCRGPKSWQPVFAAGQFLRFCLRANMTVKQEGKRRVLHGASADETQHKQLAWLTHKGEQHGFTLVPVPNGADWFNPFAEEEPTTPSANVRLVPLPTRVGHRPARDGKPNMEVAHTGVDCDGVLRVTDAALFATAITNGIGPAKAFGYGLLSVAALR